MSTFINLAADFLLATLLVSTIASSVALSRRITRLKGDESAMRKTVGDLIVASDGGACHRGPAHHARRLRPHARRPPAHGRALRRRSCRADRSRRDGDEPDRSDRRILAPDRVGRAGGPRRTGAVEK